MASPGGAGLTATRYALTALVGASGVLHFAAPRGYEGIVPRPLRAWRREIVFYSGVAEVACVALMTLPPTRRLGGWLTAALLLAVFPANIQAAMDGGMRALPAPLDSPAVAWARLPLQLPMVAIALRIATQADHQHG